MLDQLHIHVNIDTELTSFTKMNSKWIIDLNVTWKPVKFLEENKGGKLCDFGVDDEFLDTTPKRMKDSEPRVILHPHK